AAEPLRDAHRHAQGATILRREPHSPSGDLAPRTGCPGGRAAARDPASLGPIHGGGVMSDVMVEVSQLHCTFGAGRASEVRAVDDVTFSIHEGETFGLVGESGSGKTTTGRAMVGLHQPSSGTIRYQDRDVHELIH